MIFTGSQRPQQAISKKKYKTIDKHIIFISSDYVFSSLSPSPCFIEQYPYIRSNNTMRVFCPTEELMQADTSGARRRLRQYWNGVANSSRERNFFRDG